MSGSEHDNARRNSLTQNGRRLSARLRNNQNGRRLSTDSITFALPTNNRTKTHAEEHHGVNSWRYKVLELLYSPPIEYALMGLLLTDVIVLFVELFLLAMFPSCDIVERDAISCCPSPSRFLAEDDSSHDFCEAGLEAAFDNPASCDSHKWRRVHVAENALFIMTLIILSLFFLELNICMVALKPRVFFRQFFFLIDYIVISFGLTLEVAFHLMGSATSQSLVGLLVTVRLWRFLRIGHGLVEVTHEVEEKQFGLLLAYTEELESLLEKNHIRLTASKSVRKLKHEKRGDILADIAKHHRSKHAHIKYFDERYDDDDDDDGAEDYLAQFEQSLDDLNKK